MRRLHAFYSRLLVHFHFLQLVALQELGCEYSRTSALNLYRIAQLVGDNGSARALCIRAAQSPILLGKSACRMSIWAVKVPLFAFPLTCFLPFIQCISRAEAIPFQQPSFNSVQPSPSSGIVGFQQPGIPHPFFLNLPFAF